jgi:hypothetical protein
VGRTRRNHDETVRRRLGQKAVGRPEPPFLPEDVQRDIKKIVEREQAWVDKTAS